MQDIKIHIGDVLQIRSFEDMKSEFGVDQDGYIYGGHDVWFGDGMEALCGNVFTVSEISDGEYRSIEGVEDRTMVLIGVYVLGCLNRMRKIPNGKLQTIIKLHFCCHNGGFLLWINR